MDTWLASAQGRHLLASETVEMRRALDSVFGDQLVQIGAWGSEVFIKAARTQRAAVAAETLAAGVHFVSHADELAVMSDSVDAVVLAHVLESHPEPHAVLREVDRVLRPDGHLIVAGFNPYGLWGLRHMLSRRRFPPGMRQLIPEGRLKDWLQLLSFRIEETRFYHYQIPFGAGAAAGSDRRDNESGNGARQRLAARGLAPMAQNVWHRTRAWPPFAACYLTRARKQMYTLTPVRPVWQRRRRLVAGLVNPTTRNAA